MNHEIVFTNIYDSQEWGQTFSNTFTGSSGPGSSIEYNREYIGFLRSFLQTYQIRSVVDLGCGDWRCGTAIYSDIPCSYTGYDVYKKMIESHRQSFRNPLWQFECKNCAAELDTMVDADLLIVKDVLQHWSDEEVTHFMEYQMKAKKYKYILITNCVNEYDGSLQKPGGWRQLSKTHPLLIPYALQEIFRYDTKQVLLFSPSSLK